MKPKNSKDWLPQLAAVLMAASMCATLVGVYMAGSWSRRPARTAAPRTQNASQQDSVALAQIKADLEAHLDRIWPAITQAAQSSGIQLIEGTIQVAPTGVQVGPTSPKSLEVKPLSRADCMPVTYCSFINAGNGTDAIAGVHFVAQRTGSSVFSLVPLFISISLRRFGGTGPWYLQVHNGYLGNLDEENDNHNSLRWLPPEAHKAIRDAFDHTWEISSPRPR